MDNLEVPGKVLFYGGYSVLKNGYPSLCIAVVDERGRGVSAEWELSGEERIRSPQFNIDAKPELGQKELVSYAYITAKLYLKAKAKWQPVEVELENSPIFGEGDEKSGLGSSAAATIAVIKALFEANGYDSEIHSETIFKLGQFAYGWFSGKIGSGFDIATAAIGQTIVYYRYNPEMVVLPSSLTEEEVEKSILTSVEKPWEWVRIRRVRIPAELLVFNIKGGSTSTISAVKAWKEWKTKKPDEFNKLMEKQKAAEEVAIQALLAGDYEKVREYTRKAREAHRAMQEGISQVVSDFEKIEPEELTWLIDEAEERYPEVIAGRCPGAGGKDSVAFLVKPEADLEGLAKNIEQLGKEQGLVLSWIHTQVV